MFIIQGVSVKRFRTPMSGRVYPENSKSYKNARSEVLFWSGDVHRSMIKERDRKLKKLFYNPCKKAKDT